MINVTDKKECSGCYGCVNICPSQCIHMETDQEGFWYPIVDRLLCIDCGLCEEVCPIITKNNTVNNPRAYACYNKEELVRLESSSGGLFTLIAEQVITQGGIVFGSAFDNNFELYHSFTSNMKSLGQYRGSKYLQSCIGDSFVQVKEILVQGIPVLFSGTPCQIEGLKSYLQKDYGHLTCIDFICHGVPSPKVWKKYLGYRESIDRKKPRRIAFRRKNEGWKRYSVSFSYENDTEYVQTMDKDLYMRAFLKDVCLRPSCYSCSFKSLHRVSDITLADFWGIQELLPEMDDDKGTSLIFLNNNHGKKIFDDIQDKIVFKEVDISKAIQYNPSATQSVAYNPKREIFFEQLEKLPFEVLVKRYCSDSIYRRGKQKAKYLVCKYMK